MLNYVRRFKHITPLWFANVANNILWWTFVKACWRAAGSMMANRGITFKTTMKARAQHVIGGVKVLNIEPRVKVLNIEPRALTSASQGLQGMRSRQCVSAQCGTAVDMG